MVLGQVGVVQLVVGGHGIQGKVGVVLGMLGVVLGMVGVSWELNVKWEMVGMLCREVTEWCGCTIVRWTETILIRAQGRWLSK